jgi:hypothetical protein
VKTGLGTMVSFGITKKCKSISRYKVNQAREQIFKLSLLLYPNEVGQDNQTLKEQNRCVPALFAIFDDEYDVRLYYTKTVFYFNIYFRSVMCYIMLHKSGGVSR